MKKVLCIMVTACLLAGVFAVPAFAKEQVPLQPGWGLASEPVYYMDFSPDTDGKFYDSPKGTENRMEVPREANPDGISLTSRDENVDNKIIANTDNTSKLVPSGAAAGCYAAFSNRGASGAGNDYSLKIAHAFNQTQYSAAMTLPKAYGCAEDSYKKYRFEADWQYAYYNSSGLASYALNSDMPIIRFYFSDTQYIGFQTKAGGRPNECRGDYALAFYDGGTNSSTSTFGFSQTETDTKSEDEAKVTMSAQSLSAKNSGKWIHITVDFDFANNTIYATFESDIEKREISATVSKNVDIFRKGISKLYFNGSKRSVAILNFYDNIKLTPIVPANTVSDLDYTITNSGESQAKVDASVEINAGVGFDSPLTLIAAAYDGDKLIGVRLSEAVSLAKGETGKPVVSLDGLPAASTQDMKMKFFLWDANMRAVKMWSVPAWGSSAAQ